MPITNNTDKLLSGYELANKDANDLIQYLEEIKDPSQLKEENFPSLVKELSNKDSDVSKKYISTATLLGGSVASAVTVSISTSALSSGILGKLAIGGLTAAGAGGVFGGVGLMGAAMIPAVGWFVLPVAAVPLGIKLLSELKIKNYIKNNKSAMQNKKTELEKQKKKLIDWLFLLQEKAKKIDEELTKNRTTKFNSFKNKAKKLAKDISIQIDDCLNADTNKRILQYNEVILNQYRFQKELEDKVKELFEDYNSLLEEKKELERQVACLLRLLNAMGCPESVIEQALAN